MVENQLLQRYVSSRPNHVICVDVSFLTAKKSYFVGIDLATRVVVGHFYKKSPVQVRDVIIYLMCMLEARKFTNSVSIVHSDRESLFSNDNYYDFLKHKNVLVSRGSSKGYDNQVVERLHRTLKEKLKKAAINHESAVIRKNFSFGHLKSSLLEELLNDVIEDYNNTPHKANFGLSPNAWSIAFVTFNNRLQVDEVLILKDNSKAVVAVLNKNVTDIEKPSGVQQEVKDAVVINDVLVKNNSSVESQEVQDLRKQVALGYANNWEEFFLDWRRDQAVKDERLFQENLILRKELREVHNTLDYVADQTKINQLKRHKRELAKQKRDLAVKLPLRDVVSQEEFETILNLVKSNSFSDCRRRLALVLLYITGLRVSNLLVLNVLHLKALFKEGRIVIPLIKNGASRHSIELSPSGICLLNCFKKSLNVICCNKTVSEPVFSSMLDCSKAISRESLDRELNSILVKASAMFGKHLRTHSFRATFITDLLINVPIDSVKKLIGHSDIKSTLTYKRSRLTEKDIKKVLNQLDETRNKTKKKELKKILFFLLCPL